MSTPSQKLSDETRRTRSQGNTAVLLLRQQENLAMLQEQCRLGQTLRAAERLPGQLQLRRRVSAIEDSWNQCHRVHQELQMVSEETDVATYLQSNHYATARTVSLSTLDDLSALEDRVVSTQSRTIQESDVDQPTSSSRVNPLERIPIPSFDGEAKDYPTFKDLFTSMVVNESSISNVYKFYYLKRALKGNALSLIKNITVTNENFESAWKIVKDYYQDSQVLIFSYLVQLLKLEPVNSGKFGQLERLIMQTREILASLEALSEPVEEWSSLIVVLTLLRLDSTIRSDWERHVGKRATFPKYTELEEFLQARVHADAVAGIKSGVTTHSNSASPSRVNMRGEQSKVNKYNSHVSTSSSPMCLLCKSAHFMSTCKLFIKLAPEERLKKARSLRCCYNCFRVGHYPRDCHSKIKCFTCSRRHHTLLHEALNQEFSENSKINIENMKDKSPSSVMPSVSSHAATPMNVDNSKQFRSENILLATAMVRVFTQVGRVMTLRALIDQGSERSFMSESAAQLLLVKRRPLNASIAGIGGQQSGRIKYSTEVQLASVISEQTLITVQCLILSKLTTYLPRKSINLQHWPAVSQLPLADPDPTSSAAIDLILGADVYGDILHDGILRFPNEPVAQLTIFGWILSGPYPSSNIQESEHIVNSLHVTSNTELRDSIKQFWEIEEIPKERFLSADEQACEDLFSRTTARDPSGRYHVSLPFKSGPPIDIGDSYSIAHKQYLRLERRLSQDSKLSQDYHSFLQEYRVLGHMVEYIPSDNDAQVCYIPHHPVIKSLSTTTKVRVVFNASCKTSNTKSLNDNLFIGCKLQQDLSSIMCRFRTHQYVMVSDVEKMFRQIGVHDDCSRYQLILWRPEDRAPVKTFRLKTVTYGTSPAPYLALRVLNKLAVDESSEYPLAAAEIFENVYVDDMVFGASSIDQTRLKRDQLIGLTQSGGFKLRKWSSNSPLLLQDLPAELCETSNNIEFQSKESLKILGISWNVSEDCFRFAVSSDPPNPLTKRTALSFISKLFDPLGWVTPVIVVAKIFMQQLWLCKLDWDTPLPVDTADIWQNFVEDLPMLPDIKIPRWIDIQPSSSCQIHAFCDASQLAYAAVIYLRVDSPEGVRIHLITSKSKVASLQTLTIPRLELCAAELLSRLLCWTLESLKLDPVKTEVFAWSDSTITLTWIGSDPSRYKIFVANRVARINSRLKDVSWRYVPTDSNPADLASRGTTVFILKNNSLWWHGPAWLHLSEDCWPSINPLFTQPGDLEERIVQAHVTQVSLLDLALRSSDWGKLIRATAIFLRYKDILLARIRKDSIKRLLLPDSKLRRSYHDQAVRYWIKDLQYACFADELSLIRKGMPLPRGNRLISLDPYIDQDNILRVGGRLSNTTSVLSFQHPIILCKHYVTRLIIRQAHQRTLHGGISITMRYLSDTYWIVRAKTLIRSEISKCVPCTRNRATLITQRMASLPSLRTERHRPFQRVGVDYAGPICVRIASGRGHKSHKAYIAVFVCMTTRAVHVELVHDYSTPTFLAAFKRFCARRGLPSIVISDNGANFHGANNELKRQLKTVLSDPLIADILANDSIEWQFNPPGAPHFGGIWEAGVKSIKFHLRRVAGDHTLTSEEFNTLLCQIEACLNSRPTLGFLVIRTIYYS